MGARSSALNVPFNADFDELLGKLKRRDWGYSITQRIKCYYATNTGGINSPNIRTYETWLHAYATEPSRLKALLDPELKAPPNMLDDWGQNALTYAARLNNGNDECVRMLIAAKCDCNNVGRFGGTALQGAAKWGRLDMCKELIEVRAV